MDLSKFVEQKRTEKEEKVKAEKERQVAEFNESMGQEMHDRERDEASHQRAELERQENIRNKISALEQEKKDVLDSLAGWKTGQEEMVSAAKTTKEKRRGLKKTVEKGKEFFAEEGIKDVKELLKSEKFAEAGEVKSYQESERALLEKVKELKGYRRKATGQERGHLSKAEKESAKKIEKINKELQELREQTPEGQRELKESAKKEILERHQKLNHWVLYEYNGLRSTNFVEHEDLKLVPKAGEGLIKETILKHYLEQLDDQLDREGGGVATLKKELEDLKKLPEKMEEANSALHKLERLREETEKVMRENMENAGVIEKVGLTGSPLEEERAKKSVRAHVDNYLGNFTAERRINTREHTPDIDYLLDKKRGYSQTLIDIFKSFRENKDTRILQGGNSGGEFVFSFPNPDYVKEVAEIFSKFLETIVGVLKQKPDVVLGGLKDPKLEPFYKPEKMIEARKDLTLKNITYDALRYGWSSLEQARAKIHNFETRRKTAGEAVTAKFEKDWNQAKLQELDHNKKAYEIASKKRDIDIWKERAKKVLSQLPEMRLDFKDRMEEEIAVSHSSYGRSEEKFSLTCIKKQEKVDELYKEAEELQKLVKPQKEKVGLKKTNEPRWFRKEKYAAELEELEQELFDLEQKIKTKKEEASNLYKSVESLVIGLSEILKISGAVDESMKGKDFTVKELLAMAEKKAKEDSEAKLSPAEEGIYKKRVDLEEAVQRALQKIKKIYPNY